MAKRRRTISGSKNSLSKDAAKAFEIEGLNEILGNVAAVMDGVTGRAVKETYLKAGLVLRDNARRLAPRRTGTLRLSIFAARGDENKPNVLVGADHRIAYYAHMVEYGTVRQPARPFLRPAISASAPEMKRIIETGLRQIINDRIK